LSLQSCGIFVNDDLGSHTRYAYNSCKSAIVIRAEEKILVINAKTPEATWEIYNNLLEKTK
jgi:hypothetical protein